MGEHENDTPGSAMTYREVCNRLDDIRDDLERLNAREDKDGGLSTEDMTRFADLTTEFEELYALKGRKERDGALQRVQRADISRRADSAAPTVTRRASGADDFDADPLGDPDSIVENRFKDPWDLGQVRMGLSAQERGQELRARAYSAIEKMSGTTSQRRETATRMVERWDTTDGKLSEQVLCTSSPAYLRAFGKLAASQGRAILSPEEQRAVDRAMSLTDSAGGYLVPFQLDPTVILTSDGSLNQIRQVARQVIATGDVWNGVSAGAVAWSFDAEAAEVSDDSPTFAQPSITVQTARGFVPISLEAAMDAQNVASEVGRLLAQGKDDLEAVVFVTGASGSKQPNGIVPALVAYEAAHNSTVVVPSSGANIFTEYDVYNVQGKLPARYRPRSSWLSSNTWYNLVRQFDTSGGGGMWAQIGADRPAQLLGRPVYEAEAVDSSWGSGENYVSIYGDFSNYVIADRIGMQVEFIQHLFGGSSTTHYPTGQRGWFAYYRVGADVVNPLGLRMLNIT